MRADYCVIGLGPAGLGAALSIVRGMPGASLVCLDAGAPARDRQCTVLIGKGCRQSVPCQIISGVGGSSVLSGGKISGYPAGSSMGSILKDGDAGARAVLQTGLDIFSSFVPLTIDSFTPGAIVATSDSFASKGFEFRHYDAFRYDRSGLLAGYDAMLAELSSTQRCELRLGTSAFKISPADEGFTVECVKGQEREVVQAANVVVATGRLGKDLLTSLVDDCGVSLLSHDCDVGVRLEFPSSVWPDIADCHGDLKLLFGAARTFCVCAEGVLAPYRAADQFFLTEGHSDLSSPSGFTNLGITIRRSPQTVEGPMFDALRRRAKAPNGMPIREHLSTFLERTPTGLSNLPSSISYWTWGTLGNAFPPEVAGTIKEAVAFFVDRLLPKTDHSHVTVFGPELDQYWPRVEVAEDFGAVGARPGLFVVGDAVGRFRGILQAFSTGYYWGNFRSQLGQSR